MIAVTGQAPLKHTYDAIVIGSGISGGWAAKELCESGLKTLLLERGRDVEHIVDYPTALMKPWDMKYRGHIPEKYKLLNPVQTAGQDEGNLLFYANDEEHPYIQERPFAWFRGYQVGGRSLTWGRQCYRLSDLDFRMNSDHGVGVDWPIRYKDLEKWYDYVERFIGVSGKKEDLPQLPDGVFLPPFELNCVEKQLAESLKKIYNDRILTIARVANATSGMERGQCLARNLCSRGCPYGGYFNTNSGTLPAALKTGNLTLRPFSIVSELVYDDRTRKVSGVRVIDTISRSVLEFHARVIFVNASTLNTTAILLQSVSSRFPNGLGNDSGQVGHNLMDHHSSAGVTGVYPGMEDAYYKGRRPCGFIIPRYVNLNRTPSGSFIGGYNLQGGAFRSGWRENADSINGFGQGFKERVLRPGPWAIWMGGWGECLPYFDNEVKLHPEEKDQWGLPVLSVNFSFRENEKSMMNDICATAEEMLSRTGFQDVRTFNYDKPGGATVHEMGTARMGNDPRTSVLNKFNQMHSVRNVFITDGSCMTSSACQNPSLTYMALTARACRYAVDQLKQGLI